MNCKVTTNGNVDNQENYEWAVACGTYNNGNDKINNIYELKGNLSECTLEAVFSHSRVVRGGDYSYSASLGRRSPYVPTDNEDYAFGSRLSLYIK